MAAARPRFARTRGDQQQLTSGVSCRRLGARRPHSDATDVLGRAEPARVGADRPDRGQRREDIGREPRGESRPCHSSLVIGGELLLVRSSVSRRSATSSSSRESAARWRTRAAKRAMKPVEERGPREAAWHERSMSVRRLYTELGHYNSHTESFGVESLLDRLDYSARWAVCFSASLLANQRFPDCTWILHLGCSVSDILMRQQTTRHDSARPSNETRNKEGALGAGTGPRAPPPARRRPTVFLFTRTEHTHHARWHANRDTGCRQEEGALRGAPPAPSNQRTPRLTLEPDPTRADWRDTRVKQRRVRGRGGRAASL